MKINNILINGLRCLAGESIECKNCKYNVYSYPECCETVARDVLDILNDNNESDENMEEINNE